ncbi:hypothetical protein AMTR_s00041p00208340 [Amborella trichopoda]|uniref:Uncharacterized protein n=1 Tax=Amborella trichopoda TaxID=13333 RepID=W1PYP7_AMBTC|nr:hypothetical protein AMTR_s00041p00208340 [Amborella trichopoda]
MDNGELWLKNRKIISSESYGSGVGSKLGGGYGIILDDVPNGPSPIGNHHGEGRLPSVSVLEGRMLGDVPNGPYPTNGGADHPPFQRTAFSVRCPAAPSHCTINELFRSSNPRNPIALTTLQKFRTPK